MDIVWKWLSNRAIDPERYRVSLAATKDLEAISDLDADSYGDHSVDTDGLKAWHKQYNFGAYALWHRTRRDLPWEIVGSLGIWPVRPDVFERLVTGTMKETDIDATCIMPGKPPAQNTHWYVGGVTLRKDLRHEPLLGQRKGLSARAFLILMKFGLKDWLEKGRFADEVHICAIQAGDLGGKLAEIFGFEAKKDGNGVAVLTPLNESIYQAKFKSVDLRKSHLVHTARFSFRWIVDICRDYAMRGLGALILGGALAYIIIHFFGARIDTVLETMWQPWLYAMAVLAFLTLFAPNATARRVLFVSIFVPLGVFMVQKLFE